MRKFYLFSTTVLLLLFGLTSAAQDFSNKGKDFWVAYGYHERMGQPNGGSQDMLLYFAAEVAANVTVTIPGIGYTQTFAVPANTTIASTPIPKTTPDARLTGASTAPENKGIHITSDKPVVAYAHIYNSSVSGSTILYPTNTLGREYYSVNFTNNSNVGNSNCWFYVIAADPGTTTVEITPSASAVGHTANTPFTVNLTQGQVYQVMGTYSGSSGTDLTGSKIQSVNTGEGCKRIAVFSGSGRIAISCNGANPSSDNYIVQSVPKSAWGKKYLTTPIVSYSTPSGNTSSASTVTFYRACVSDPTTVVRINGAITTLPLINNFYYQIPATTAPQLIEADKPITVAQYFPSQNNGGAGGCGTANGDGDPEVIYLSPVEQSINKVLWNASARFQINQSKHYINAVIPNAGTAITSFTLDGVQVPATNFLVHPQDPAYSYVRLNVASLQGNPTANTGLPHIIQSDSSFNAIAYGYGGAESYGYNAGTNIKDIFQYVSVQNQYGTVNFPATCRNTPFYFSMTFPYQPTSILWMFNGLFPDFNMPDPSIYFTGTIIVAGKTLYQYRIPTPYTIPNAGIYPIKVNATNPTPDGCGGTQEIDYDVQVFNNPIADFNFNDVCFPNPVQFTDNSSTDGRPIISRYWDFGDISTSNVNNPSHPYAAPGSYNVKYSIITDIGCIADTVTHLVTVSPLPTASISGAIAVCLNAPPPDVTFTGAAGTAPYTFTYNINGGVNQTVTTTSGNSVTVSAPTGVTGTFTYNLISVQDGSPNLCSQTQTGSVVVQVNPLPTANITGTIAVCKNSPSPDVTFIGALGVAPYTFTYNINGGGSQTITTVSGNSVTIAVPTNTPGTFAYNLLSVQDASNTLCSQNQNGTATITVNDLPTANIAGTIVVCVNAAPPLVTFTGATGIAPYTFTYNINGGPNQTITTTTGNSVSISAPTNIVGTFNYNLVSVEDGSSTLCTQAQTGVATVTVTGDATLTLTSAPPTANQTRCINRQITDITYQWGGTGTNATVTGLPTGVTFSISGNVVTISGTPTVSGTFNFIVQTDGPCFKPQLTGSITVTTESKVILSSALATRNQELCIYSTLTEITYDPVGSTTSITVTGLPTGLAGVIVGGQLRINGSPTQAGTFNYVITPVGPCYENIPDGGTIIVNQLPTPNFSVTTPSCETKVLTFTDLSTPNSGALNGWSWTFGDAGTSLLQNPTHTYAAAGTYTVTLSVTNDKGCVSNPILSRNVTVNAQPVTDAILPEVCLSDTYAQFYDNSSVAAPGSITSWLWNFGDPGSGPLNTSTLEDPQHSYSATGNYTVTLTTTTNNGCSSTATFPFTINGDIPVANFNALNPTTMCANDSISIQDASTVNFGSITKVEIYWDNVGAPATFDTDNTPTPGKIYKHKYPNFQAPLTRTFNIRYRAYSGGTCVNDRIRTITVNAAPKVQFNNMPPACLDAAPFQITQATETGGVPGSGVFTGPGVTSGGIFNPASVGPGTYLIKYTYTSSAGGCVDTLSKPITVIDSASARFTYSPINCEKQAVTFNSTTSTIPAGAGTITGWNWNFGDPASGAANTSTLQNPSHTFTGWGNYTVTLSVSTSNACRSTVNSSSIFVNPIPRPNFTVPASVCLPAATIAFNSSPSSIPDGTQASFTYLWNFGDPASGALNTATGSSPSHIYNTAGPFNVNLQITSGAGCVHDTTIVVNNIHPQPLGSFTVDKTEICVGAGSFTFTDNSNPMDGTTTQWNWNMDDGNTRTTRVVNYTFANARTYNVTLYIVNSHGCRSTSFTLPVTVHPYPVVDAGPDRIMLEGGQIVMEPNVTGSGLTYLWTPTPTGVFAGSNTIRNPAINGIDDILLTLTVTGVGGCKDDDQVFIKVLKFPSIPNIFSPNGDGVHDRWVIDYLNTYPGSTVDIYNRYGQLIFHSDGYAMPWDGTVGGKPVPVGTYYYIVNPKNGRKIMSGYVDVIR